MDLKSIEKIRNLSLMITDLIEGNESIAQREDFKKFNFQELKDTLNLVLNNPLINDNTRNILLQESWRLIYREKPPTIYDFCTTKYLGGTAESLYPYIKEILYTFFNPNEIYRNLILSSHIGNGKSFLSILSNLFCATHLWLMRNAKHYLGVAPSTILSQILISFTLEKAKELLVDPFVSILETSEFFERCKTIESLDKKQKYFGNTKICWTTAGATSAFTFSGGTSIKIAASATRLLGINIIMGTVSEIAFFRERGFSEEYIWRIVNDLKGRIQNRFPNNYWARSIMDSSPNDLEGCIDQYIFGGEAEKDETNLIIKGSEWEWQPWKYTDESPNQYIIDTSTNQWWLKDWKYINKKSEIFDKVFHVYKGNNNIPAKVLLDEEIHLYDENQIIKIPILRKQLFEDAIVKALKDYAGIPAGSENELIQSKEKIEGIFTNNLKNIYTFIHASSDEKPEKLIWNLIKDEFFIQYDSKRFQFYRNPSAPRVFSADQSINGDDTGLAVSHLELSPDGDLVYVADFSLSIVPKRNKKINLDAIKFFILDLRDLGNLDIMATSFDRFESESTIQFLEREGFKNIVKPLSVDRNINIYLSYLNLINTGLYKCGKNIILKNNLKSLQITINSKTGYKKIDHKKGKLIHDDGGKWESSKIGYYAKDLSDPTAANIELLKRYPYMPSYIYDPSIMENLIEINNIKCIDINRVKQKLGFK